MTLRALARQSLRVRIKEERGKRPADIEKTHARVLNPAFMRELDDLDVPLRRWGAHYSVRWVYAPRWACVLVDEWTKIEPIRTDDTDSLHTLRALVHHLKLLPDPVMHVEAALAILRLQGRVAVLASITKDVPCRI